MTANRIAWDAYQPEEPRADLIAHIMDGVEASRAREGGAASELDGFRARRRKQRAVRWVAIAALAFAGTAAAFVGLYWRNSQVAQQGPAANATAPEVPPKSEPPNKAMATPKSQPDRPAKRERSWAKRLKDAQARRALLGLIAQARNKRRASAQRGLTGSGGQPRGDGTLSKEYIKSTVLEAKPLVRECYQLALRTAPQLAGRLVANFVIAAEPTVGGLVESVELKGGEPIALNPTLKECVEQTLYSLEFPEPSDGGRVTVNYPFVFAHQEPKDGGRPQ